MGSDMAPNSDRSTALPQRAAAGGQYAVRDLPALHRERLKRMVRFGLTRRLKLAKVDRRHLLGRTLQRIARLATLGDFTK
jgi:hypothetical protein